MKCGFYELDITPAMGSIIPGGFAARYGQVIEEKLYVRGTVFMEEEKVLAIASVDACGITLDITERVRERVAKFAPLPA